MDDSVLQELRTAKDAAEKAAIVAEFILQDLPPEIALVARRCVLLHWFDESIITALTQGTTLSADDIEIVYEHIASLPFIETVSWGLTFQDLTREGLLRRYTYSQQELLKTAARLAAPAYEVQSDEKIVAEAFFCHMIAGNQQASMRQLDTLLTQASNRNDWQHIDNLLHLQEEAEVFPFVQPLPRTEQQWLIRGLVHSIQGKRDEAILDYDQALTFNSRNALTYLSRGTTYAQQERYKQALSDYKKSLRFDPTLSQAYLNRGIIYTKQQNYKQALKDFNLALQRDPGNTFILQNQGNTLNELGHFEEALATSQKAVNIDPYVAETYIGKGKTHIELGQYANALAAYERAIQLDGNAVDAYIGKGKALFELERYGEALVSYEEALRLAPSLAEAYMGKGKALSRLKRYEEANIAFNQARQLDPHTAEVDEEQEYLDANDEVYNPVNTPMKAKAASFRGRGSTGRLRKPSRLRQKSAGRGQSLVWYRLNRGLALVPVAAIIIFSLVIFGVHSSTLGGSQQPNATTTAEAKVTHTSTPLPHLEKQYHEFTLHIDANGLLNNSQSAINDVKQQVRAQTFLKNREVSVAIVYGGAPSDAEIAQAQSVATKVYSILAALGGEGFAFQRSSYYVPLYNLGPQPSQVTVDVYLFSQVQDNQRLDLKFREFGLTVHDINGLLNDSPSAINDIEQQIRNQPFLQQGSVGLAIVYGGTPDDAGISEAQTIASKVYRILGILGQQGFAFQRSSYYVPLYNLGSQPSQATVDVYLYQI